jgi:hypothetical protein
MRAITPRPLVPLASVDGWIRFAEGCRPPTSAGLAAPVQDPRQIRLGEASRRRWTAGRPDQFPVTVANGIAEDQLLRLGRKGIWSRGGTCSPSDTR